MDFGTVTVWTVIKRFLFGWIAAGGLLVIVSCVKYREFIITAFLNNTWAWINALMPVVIILVGIRLQIPAHLTTHSAKS
jgi:hypothetical protein